MDGGTGRLLTTKNVERRSTEARVEGPYISISQTKALLAERRR